jgi:uncharacterized protein (DUF488 family)
VTALFTIGYEGLALDQFLAQLKAEKIGRLVDIRMVPASRKRGFSKGPLSIALGAEGIEYVHVRSAGNAFRKEADSLAKYAAALDEDAVIEVADAVAGHRAVLLCFEHDPATCHRAIIAPRVARRLKLPSVGNL